MSTNAECKCGGECGTCFEKAWLKQHRLLDDLAGLLDKIEDAGVRQHHLVKALTARGVNIAFPDFDFAKCKQAREAVWGSQGELLRRMFCHDNPGHALCRRS